MKKKGLQNSSIEQVKNDHETESAFRSDHHKGHEAKRTSK